MGRHAPGADVRRRPGGADPADSAPGSGPGAAPGRPRGGAGSPHPGAAPGPGHAAAGDAGADADADADDGRADLLEGAADHDPPDLRRQLPDDLRWLRWSHVRGVVPGRVDGCPGCRDPDRVSALSLVGGSTFAELEP